MDEPVTATGSFPDVPSADGAPAVEFDRFYFAIHPPALTDHFLVVGAGIYPGTDVVDAYLCASWDGEQRNLRLSSQGPGGHGPGQVGPLAWTVLEPCRRWRLQLGPNATDVEFDLLWECRSELVEVAPHEIVDADGRSHHAHYFQSGRVTGTLGVDGLPRAIDGWYGQRDRSRGQRRVRDRLGLHQWVQVQFDREWIGLLLNEDRRNEVVHCDGALVAEGGAAVRVVSAAHDLELGTDLELEGGRLELTFADGQERLLQITSPTRGIYLSGAGYGGFHGVPRGVSFEEFERWPLDGSITPRSLDLGLTDAFCGFDSGGERGVGIYEYAVTRSPSYSYRPSSSGRRRERAG